MSSDIISALNLDKEIPSGKVYVVKEVNGCEGSFVTSCILGHQVKRKCATLLVTLHQLLDHYHNVGLRMGYNLMNQQKAGLLRVVSPAEMFIQKLLGDQSTDNFIDEILTALQENITYLVNNHAATGPVCVYVDGLTHLLNLGYSLKSINSFVRTLIEVVQENECFIVFNCSVGSEEEDSTVLTNLLCHVSHSVVAVESLASGRSADVSGHLAVRRSAATATAGRTVTLCTRMHITPTRYHFRLFDRGVKLFAPGTVGL